MRPDMFELLINSMLTMHLIFCTQKMGVRYISIFKYVLYFLKLHGCLLRLRLHLLTMSVNLVICALILALNI